MNSVLEKIGHLLRERIGLNVASVGTAALDHAVRLRMRQLGVARLDEYWQRLRDGDEAQALIEVVTVPETCFFRQPAAFEAFVDYALNHWLRAAPRSPLR